VSHKEVLSDIFLPQQKPPKVAPGMGTPSIDSLRNYKIPWLEISTGRPYMKTTIGFRSSWEIARQFGFCGWIDMD